MRLVTNMGHPKLFKPERFYDFIPRSGGILGRLEKEAKKEAIPIIGPVLGRLLYILARSMGAKKVLELGAATGYSAIWLGTAVAPSKGQVITVEWDKATAERARSNIKAAKLSKVVTVKQGDARKLLSSLKGPYDLIFLDVEKEQYSSLLDGAVKSLRTGGLLVFDNTAFTTSGDFLERSFNHPSLETVHLYGLFPDHEPNFDAITICMKKGPSQ
jgi:caffeoyl-CoA O-methyltransferase